MRASPRGTRVGPGGALQGVENETGTASLYFAYKGATEISYFVELPATWCVFLAPDTTNADKTTSISYITSYVAPNPRIALHISGLCTTSSLGLSRKPVAAR